MHTRADHWISKGIITSICNIPDETISTGAEVMESTVVQVDQDLIEFIKGGLKSEISSGYLEAIMEYDLQRMTNQSNRSSEAVAPYHY